MSNCDNCIFRGQWCEKENKCPLFKKTRNLKKERIAMNREKVMSWLEGLAESDWRVFHSDSEVQNIAKSALELLKEQEAVKPVLDEQTGRIWLCGKCGSYVGFEDNDPHDPNEFDKYCRECGKPVLWEGR